MKWGEFDRIDPKLLRQAVDVMQKQQAASGMETTTVPSFAPACIIGDHGVAHGMRLSGRLGMVDAFASVAVTNFFLGYLYLLIERDELSAAIAALDEDERGAGHDGNDG